MILLYTILPMISDSIFTFFMACGMLALFGITRLFPIILPTFYLIGAYFIYFVWSGLMPFLVDISPYESVYLYTFLSLLCSILIFFVAKIFERYIFRYFYGVSIWLQVFFSVSFSSLIIYLLTLFSFESDLSVIMPFSEIDSSSVFTSWDFIIIIAGIIILVVFLILEYFTKYLNIRKLLHENHNPKNVGVDISHQYNKLFSLFAGIVAFFGAMYVPKVSAYSLISFSILFNSFSASFMSGFNGFVPIILSSIFVSMSSNFLSLENIDLSFFLIIISVFLVYFFRKRIENFTIPTGLNFSIKVSILKQIALVIIPISIIFLITNSFYVLFCGLAYAIGASGALLFMRKEPFAFFGHGLFFGLAVFFMGTLLSLGVRPIFAVIPVIFITAVIAYFVGIIWKRITPNASIWISILLTLFSGALVQMVDSDASSVIIARLPSYISSLSIYEKSSIVLLLFIIFVIIAFIYKYVLIHYKKLDKKYLHLPMVFSGVTSAILAVILVLTQKYSISAPFIFNTTILMLFLAFFASIMRIYILLPLSIIVVAIQGSNENIGLPFSLIMMALTVFLLIKERKKNVK